MAQRLHAVVHGQVQGVSFRYYTVMTARRLQLTGWVRNRQDGTVETTAEGDKPALDRFLDFLHTGSPSARVSDVQTDWTEASGEFEDFAIRY